MLWIATVFLLLIAAWLFFNGLNEKRWVDAHSHDETVASDQGLFAGFAARPMMASNDEKLSIDQENTRFARAVGVVKRKSHKVGDYFDRRAKQARSPFHGSRPASTSNEPSTSKLTESRPQTVAGAGSPIANADGLFDVMVRKVSGTVDSMENGIKKRVSPGTESEKSD